MGVLYLVGGTLVLGACADGDETAGTDGGEVDQDIPELDCERQGYPCTWAEVGPEILERTQRLAEGARASFAEGATPVKVARWLEGQEDMGLVLHDEFAVRFWIQRGRPIWVFSPEAKGRGMRAAPPGWPGELQSTSQADPVGDQAPGKKPKKAFLFLDPYRWEFALDVKRAIIEPTDDEGVRLPAIFDVVRDYKCAPGRRCPCPDDQCVQHVANVWSGDCELDEAGCRISWNVTLEHFKSWKQYDAIHLSSHGTEMCDDQGNNCAGGVASGRLVWGSLKAVAGIDPQLLDATWLMEPGIELVGPLGISRCDPFEPGTTAAADAKCDPPGQNVWREYIGLDFFKFYYRPGDLKDKLIFLNSCVSMRHRVIADYLAGPDGENAVVGWEEWTSNSAASRAAAVFYREWVKGKTAQEAFQAVSSDAQFQSMGPAFAGGHGIVRGDEPDRPAVPGPAIFNTVGSKHKRGVETIFLLDPGSEEEIVDGGTLPLASLPGNGQPDTLDALVEVIGLNDAEDPAAYVLRFRVEGREAPGTGSFNLGMGGGTYRFRGKIDLGVDLEPSRPVDLEVSADLPGGGETRWLYEDIHPASFSWTLTISSGPAAGTYRGDRAVASIDRDGRITHVGLYTGTDVRPDVVVSVLEDAGYEPGVPARRGQFEVILNYGDPERVHLDGDSWEAERIGLGTVEPHYPPTVEIRRVTEDTVEGFAEGAFSQHAPERKTLDQMGTMRVEFRARACRVGDPDFSSCTSLQPGSW